MAEFDQAARFAVKLDPAGFLRWLFPGLDPDLLFTRWSETQTIPFPGQPDRRCDTVAELTRSSGLAPSWMLILELQTEPDADIVERLLEYMARARRELRYGPHGRDKYLAALAVLNLTGPPPHSSLDMILPGSTGVAFRCQTRGLTFAQVDAGQTLSDTRAGQTARCMLPWVPLMQGGDRAETVTLWKETADREAEQHVRTSYAGLALVFADLANCLLVWRQGLEGWNMRKSRIVEEWREEGRQEGRIEAFRYLLSQKLQKRFPGMSSPAILAAVQAQTNTDDLIRWLDLLDSAVSLEAFWTAINA